MSLWIALASAAMAQDTAATVPAPYLDSNLYRPPIETEGLLWTEDAGIAADGISNGSLQSVYVYDPTASGDHSQSQVGALDVTGAAAFRGFQLGVDVPVYLVNDQAFYEGEPGLGDIAFDAKGGVLRSGDDRRANVALGARLYLPTASTNLTAAGVDAVAWEARVVGDVTPIDNLHLAANLGTRGLPDSWVNTDGFRNQWFYRAGVGYEVVPDHVGASFDVAGAMDYDRPASEMPSEPFQALLGGYGYLSDDVLLRVGVGSGVLPGHDRAAMDGMVAAAWVPGRSHDKDVDGVSDRVDQCPSMPEDVDGFQDEDGCPDADNDHDGVADKLDQCPDKPEDLDGVRDADGCPDAQNSVAIRVRDDAGRVLPQADVAIEKDGRVVKEGKGAFQADLEPGVYQLTATAPGKEPVKTSFRVYPDDQVTVSATLREGEVKK